MDEAIDIMTADGIRQPTLFCCNDEYYIKLDKKPLHINEPSCFADCIDLLLKCFFIFGLQYPDELRLVYGLFENFISVACTVGRSSIIHDFLRSINFTD